MSLTGKNVIPSRVYLVAWKMKSEAVAKIQTI